jgi:hypothetical protein
VNRPGSLGPAYKDALRLTDFSFSEWRKRAETDNFKILVLLTESTMGYCSENYKEHPQRGRWVEMLKKHHIPYVETCDTLAKHNRPSKEARFHYDGHWNEQGHIWAAETIKGYMDSHLELFSE